MTATALFACGGPDVVVTVIQPPPEVVGVPERAVASFIAGVDALELTPPDYVTARSSFEDAVAAHPAFWEAWMNLGRLYTDLALYGDAVAAFESVRAASVADQTSIEAEDLDAALIGVGQANALRGDSEAALEAYRTLIQRDETNLTARTNIAAVYVDAGDYAQARQFIGEILVAEQNHVGALNLLARVYALEDDMQMASYLWEKVMELDETLLDPRNNIGLMYVEEAEMGRAVRQFTRVVDADPANVAAHLNLGAIYLEYLNYTGACHEFSQAIALRPRNQSGMMGLAACTYGQGRAQQAYDLYHEVQVNYPENAAAYRRMGDLAFRDLDDLAAALDWYDRYLRLQGLSSSTCTQVDDDICALIPGIRQMMQQTTPRSPDTDGESDE
jgi:tetratricopeptide (TPR) repeat protein